MGSHAACDQLHLALVVLTCTVQAEHVENRQCPVICTLIMVATVQVQKPFLKLQVAVHYHLANCLHQLTSSLCHTQVFETGACTT